MKLAGEVFTKQDVLSAEHLAKLKDYVAGLPFTQPSFVYHRKKGHDVRDTSVRKSHSMSTDDPSLLAFVQEQVIPCACPDDVVAKLARDHVTFIKYEPGGFFDWHQDFSKYTINKGDKWLEMHLLVCLQGADGGDLLVKDKDWLKGIESIEPSSYQHVTNGAILFDKMMEHRGDTVTGGIKIIMTVDVLVTTKTILDNPGLNVLVEPYLETGFLAYDGDAVDNLLKSGVSGAKFCVVKVNGCTVIYDCDGAFYIQVHDDWSSEYKWSRTSDGSDDEYSISRIREAFDTDTESRYYGPLESMLEGDDINIVRGITELPKIKCPNPLPPGTLTDTLLALPVVDSQSEPERVAYTYHCNETNYGETRIEILNGFIPC